MIAPPNYFFADLPPGTPLSAAMLAEACLTLKRNRANYLTHWNTEHIVRTLARAADLWLEPENHHRKRVAEQGPARTGFSQATLLAGLDRFFEQLTRQNLHGLITQDLGDPSPLDGWKTNEAAGSGRLALATGPEFLVHIAAGNLPNPTFMSMITGLLVRSAQFVKCATGTSYLPALFGHLIYAVEPKLVACLEIAEWKGGNAELEAVLFEAANCVTATGSDETLQSIRSRVPTRSRFLGYGHRLSFGYLARDVMFGREARQLAAAAAEDVVAWDQLGCLSPHVFYVQNGGDVLPERFAEMLAEELERRELAQPRALVLPESAAAIASRRGIYEMRAAHSQETRMWGSANSTAWTVVFELEPRFQISCLNRFIYVKSVRDLTEALHGADAVRESVSTVGLAADSREAQALATQLAHWGVTRICPLGQMQNPPLAWRHDGRPALGDLITWTDWEKR